MPKDSLESKLSALRKCGIEIRPEFGPETILEEWSEEDFKTGSFEGLLMALGGETETEPNIWTSISNDIWYFDAECIEDHGDYKRILSRLKNASKGEVKIAKIIDFVDIENEVAWVEFEAEGEVVRWDLPVDNDWVCDEVFENFETLLKDYGSGRRLYSLVFGQDCLIGCWTAEQKGMVEDLTKLRFSSMTGRGSANGFLNSLLNWFR